MAGRNPVGILVDHRGTPSAGELDRARLTAGEAQQHRQAASESEPARMSDIARVATRWAVFVSSPMSQPS